MQAASLKNRVTIQSPSTSVDSVGQPLTTWTDIAYLWASIKHVNGISSIKSGADTSVVKCSVRIRYKPGINAGMRVLHGTDVYDIQAVLPDDNRVFLDLVCAHVNVES